jgi:hypothetical protein
VGHLPKVEVLAHYQLNLGAHLCGLGPHRFAVGNRHNLVPERVHRGNFHPQHPKVFTDCVAHPVKQLRPRASWRVFEGHYDAAVTKRLADGIVRRRHVIFHPERPAERGHQQLVPGKQLLGAGERHCVPDDVTVAGIFRFDGSGVVCVCLEPAPVGRFDRGVLRVPANWLARLLRC